MARRPKLKRGHTCTQVVDQRGNKKVHGGPALKKLSAAHLDLASPWRSCGASTRRCNGLLSNHPHP
eukprot:9472048-Pyramimonas_sp.AAC.2